MYQALYPKDEFPRGHPDFAATLNNLGVLLWPRGPTARRGAIMSGRWR